MRVARFLLLAVAALLQACGREEMARNTAPAAPDPASDVAIARALIDRGDVPGAIEPLRRALLHSSDSPGASRDDIELLLGQCLAAVDERTAEARIAEMKRAQFDAFVQQGALPPTPYFHDRGVDAYFRKVLLSKRADAPRIRERRVR